MVPRPRNGLSLCAGAGGLDMGLMLAEPGFETRCYVEWEEYPRQALVAAMRAGYFAPAPIWDDVTTFDGRPFRGAIDTILAGYPCQPFSLAGKRKGKDDERHLWPDIARIIREIGPRWVFLENVRGHVSQGLETVLRELRDMGWTPSAGLFSAGETGATHERQRIFIVAYADGGHTGSISGRELADAARGFGRIHTRQGQEGIRETDAAGSGCELADARGSGPQGSEQPASPRKRHGSAAHGSTAERCRPRLHPPGPADRDGWSAVLSMAPDLAPSVAFGDIARRARELAQMVEGGELAEAEAEPALRRMVDGLATRTRSLRLLGNGVHPLAAGYAWRSLSAAHGLRPLDLGADGAHSAGAGTDGDVLMTRALTQRCE